MGQLVGEHGGPFPSWEAREQLDPAAERPAPDSRRERPVTDLYAELSRGPLELPPLLAAPRSDRSSFWTSAPSSGARRRPERR